MLSGQKRKRTDDKSAQGLADEKELSDLYWKSTRLKCEPHDHEKFLQELREMTDQELLEEIKGHYDYLLNDCRRCSYYLVGDDFDLGGMIWEWRRRELDMGKLCEDTAIPVRYAQRKLQEFKAAGQYSKLWYVIEAAVQPRHFTMMKDYFARHSDEHENCYVHDNMIKCVQINRTYKQYRQEGKFAKKDQNLRDALFWGLAPLCPVAWMCPHDYREFRK